MTRTFLLTIYAGCLLSSTVWSDETVTYPIVDTDQIRCYNDQTEIAFPQKKAEFFGQDAHYLGNTPKYKDNNDK